MSTNSKNEAQDARASVAYRLDLLSTKRPGAVLAVGYGNPLKAVVRAANEYGVHPLFTTGTDDKIRAFSFGGTTSAISLGPKFDERLFTNEHAVLQAAEECSARTILCASNACPTQVLADECERKGILLLKPLESDHSLLHWEKAEPSSVSPEAVEWRKCTRCGFTSDNRDVIRGGYRCPVCSKLARLSSDERIALTFDEGSVEEWDSGLDETDALDFPDFDLIIERAQKRSGYEEGVRTGSARICGMPVAFGVMEPSFMMASMGHVVGERLTRMFERATVMRLPVVVFCTSGGARMQEGLSSLMQMAKVSAAVQAHSDAGLLYISVLCDPTTGGVTASFGTLGDVLIAEPGAVIGFAGRRVIQDTIKQVLPDDFQSSEFALEHGLVDAIVERHDMRRVLGLLLGMHSSEIVDFDAFRADSRGDIAFVSEVGVKPGLGNSSIHNGFQTAGTITDACSETMTPEAKAADRIVSSTLDDVILEDKPDTLASITRGLSEFAQNLGQALTEQTSKAGLWWTIRNKGVADYPYIKQSADKGEDDNAAWRSVQLARNVNRPTSRFYIESMFDDFLELHGDRTFADDGAIIGGIGRIGEHVVTVIAEEKGSNLKERIARNFGCPQPEGYRKSIRLMRQAQKFGRPIVCLVDTQGAYCGSEAEERGMGGAIAESLAFMSQLDVPVVSVVIGEGGSGGALALAVANKVAMQENAVYSVLSPEGFASILWKDGSRAPEAAAVMRMSAADALSMGMIEDVVPEGADPAHENPDQAAAALWLYLTNALDELVSVSPQELQTQRYERFRKF